MEFALKISILHHSIHYPLSIKQGVDTHILFYWKMLMNEMILIIAKCAYEILQFFLNK